MTMPRLPEVERLAQDLGQQIAAAATGEAGPQNKGRLWQVTGPATAGKTALLYAVGEALRGPNTWPVVVAPPPGALDAGPCALVAVGAELHKRGVLNGNFEGRLLNPKVSWGEKISDVRRWLADAADQVILLCDEPLAWRARAADDMHFSSRTDDVISALLDSACRKVVAGEVGLRWRPADPIRLQPASEPSDWLAAAAEWGLLSNAALEVGRRLGSRLADYSPLEVRLLVALFAVSSADEVVAWLPKARSRRALSARLAAALAGHKVLRSLRTVWARLALVRRPFEEELLDAVGRVPLEPLGRDILRHCLLFSEGGLLVLHDTLKADTRSPSPWLPERERHKAHETLTEFYAGKFSAAGTARPEASIALEMEAFHHSSLAGDASTAERFRPFFVDQLNALGRALSLDARHHRRPAGYESAAKVFGRAIAWDDRDDYAHHYRAYNLDVLGRDAPEVEKDFRRAIEIRPLNSWWHSRYVSFLVTRGRLDDAHNAWDRALDALGLPDESADARVYSDMHVWVARLLLHRGQLEFASDVLEGIPASVRAREPGLRAIARRLEAFLEARRTGAFVPGPQLKADWWVEGPFLLHPQLRDKKLAKWIAARVDSVHEGMLYLRAAVVELGSKGPPSYEELSIPFTRFDSWNPDEQAAKLSAGRFVEIGFYGKAPKSPMAARVHRDRPWDDQDLPPLFPDPTRYIRRT